MAERDAIIRFCDELLDSQRFADYCDNGLQLPGSSEVGKIVTGVSAHLELLQRAEAAGAQMVIAHHGLFWGPIRSLTEQAAARLRLALGAGISVAGYHLPLDAHPEIGNNALLAAALGLGWEQRFGEAKGSEIGVITEASTPLPLEELSARLEQELGQPPLVQGAGPAELRRIGIVTGAGASFIPEAISLGLDALITGEPSEHAMADAAEGGMHFIAAGHYATETLGIRRLGELVAERFGIEHEFVPVPNPV